MKYLTANVLTKMIRDATKKSHPHMKKELLHKHSCHSLRVWACVLLHEAGKDGDYIMVRLHWLSEAYHVYLRDTALTAQFHTKALQTNTDELNRALADLQLMPLQEQIEEELEMSDYIDHP
jgi:hypothetical protein